MYIQELATPVTIVDLDVLERNIETYQQKANTHNKKIMPMTKTHKSTEIVKQQLKQGACGVLVGTIDEAEAFADAGANLICFAYPYVHTPELERIFKISQKTNVLLALDTVEAAALVETFCQSHQTTFSYLLIVDVGLHRFGVSPEQSATVVKQIQQIAHSLNFVGISTHPGQVYKATTVEQVQEVCKQEIEQLHTAKQNLIENGFTNVVVHSGSTPTFVSEAESDIIDVLRPGNYVFHDVIQTALSICTIEDCALRVVATIVSKREDNKYLMNCGAKCLGLDQGAHGNGNIIGYGKIKEYPEAKIVSLSEEVGVIQSETELKIGQVIEIIPNHSCSTANLTSFVYGVRGDTVEKVIDIDVRGNSTKQTI